EPAIMRRIPHVVAVTSHSRRSLAAVAALAMLTATLGSFPGCGAGAEGADLADGVDVAGRREDLFTDPNRFWCALGSDGPACTDGGNAHGSPAIINMCWEEGTYTDPSLAVVRSDYRITIARNYNRYG